MQGSWTSAQVVREVRGRLGLSQRALSRRTGIPQPNLSDIERGRREASLSLLAHIAETNGFLLEVHLVDLDRHSAVATAIRVAGLLSEANTASLGKERERTYDSVLRVLVDFNDALKKADEDRFSDLVSAAPNPTGDKRYDAFVAAIVEDVAARKDVSPPRWTNDPCRFLKPFWFLSDIVGLHEWELETAPAAFLRHGVIAAEAELESV